MAIVVIGGGAIGRLVAGRLVQSGQRAALLARTEEPLRADTLQLTAGNQRYVIPGLLVASHPQSLPPDLQRPRLAILCVKSYDTAGALPTIDALAPEVVLTLQNGIGNEEALAAHLGAALVLSGVITSSVAHDETDPAGSGIVVTKEGGIGLAPVVAGAESGFAAELLRTAGFTVQQYGDYRAMKWSKVLLNMLGNGTAAILDMGVEAVYADHRLVDLERRAFLEALAVMGRLGLRPLNLPRYPASTLAWAMRWLPAPLLQPLLRRAIAGGRGGKIPSLLGDLQRGRARSEGAFLYGAIAQAGQATGVPVPVNQAIWQALGGIASGALPWDAFRHRPERLIEMIRDV